MPCIVLGRLSPNQSAIFFVVQLYRGPAVVSLIKTGGFFRVSLLRRSRAARRGLPRRWSRDLLGLYESRYFSYAAGSAGSKLAGVLFIGPRILPTGSAWRSRAEKHIAESLVEIVQYMWPFGYLARCPSSASIPCLWMARSMTIWGGPTWRARSWRVGRRPVLRGAWVLTSNVRALRVCVWLPLFLRFPRWRTRGHQWWAPSAGTPSSASRLGAAGVPGGARRGGKAGGCGRAPAACQPRRARAVSNVPTQFAQGWCLTNELRHDTTACVALTDRKGIGLRWRGRRRPCLL